MNRKSMLLAIWSVGAILLLAVTASAEVCFFVDFDDDDDPWTLRTTLPEGVTSALVKFVVEVPAVAPEGASFLFTVTEGCCNDMFDWGHYGTFVVAETAEFDPALVADFGLNFPLVTTCVDWSISGTFTGDWSALTPGERYFFGSATWEAFCEDYPPPCFPPTEFSILFESGGACDPGTSLMTFVCPPIAGDRWTWGSIKGLYR